MVGKINRIFSPSMTFSQRLQARRERWWAQGQLPQFSRLSGKLEGRSFMKDNGFKVPEEIGIYSKIDEIPEFSQLPSRFVLKPSSGYSAKNVFVMSDGVNLLDGKSYDRNAVISSIHQSYDGKEFKGKFLIEELLVNWDKKDGIPLDYKFYTFGDRIAFIHVIERNSGVNIRANRHWFMKEDWTDLGIKIQRTQDLQSEPLPKPDCYDELVHTVRKVGRMLDMFMRIDMYATTRGAVFGEFTPTPHGGKGYTKEADQWLGSLWRGVEGASPLAYRDSGLGALRSGLLSWLGKKSKG
jgi:hypothetical protein